MRHVLIGVVGVVGIAASTAVLSTRSPNAFAAAEVTKRQQFTELLPVGTVVVSEVTNLGNHNLTVLNQADIDRFKNSIEEPHYYFPAQGLAWPWEVTTVGDNFVQLKPLIDSSDDDSEFTWIAIPTDVIQFIKSH